MPEGGGRVQTKTEDPLTPSHRWTTLTSTTGEVRAEPAAGVSVGRTSCKVDGAAQVFQTPRFGIRVSGVQRVGGVERRSHPAVVQNHVARLHALSVPAGSQPLVETFKFKTALTSAQVVPSYPASSVGTCLFSGHGRVIHHVVDGAKEWRHLVEGGRF